MLRMLRYSHMHNADPLSLHFSISTLLYLYPSPSLPFSHTHLVGSVAGCLSAESPVDSCASSNCSKNKNKYQSLTLYTV